MLYDSDFLDLWESGSRRHPLDRALLVLGAAHPDVPFDELADWPLGHRNRALAKLHCHQFGHRLVGYVPCAGCGEKLEVELDGRLLAESGTNASDERTYVEVGGNRYRLPGTRDLAGVVNETDAESAARRLVAGCVLGAGVGSESKADGWGQRPRLQGTEVEEIGARMAEADPLAEIEVHLRCPECGRESDEAIDLVQFVWAEVEARARRILGEVHALARAYGWTEREVLSLGAGRRAIYLEMLKP
ncbi:MAG TPA: hypothetical protein VGL42_14790 [Opitutaceae bacterium]|jgi:hypothetical protein